MSDAEENNHGNAFREKVLLQLQSLHDGQRQLNGDMQRISAANDRVNAEISALVTGGVVPSRGLMTRVDRIEQERSAEKFWRRTAVVAAISALVGTVWQWLIHGGKP